MTKTQKYENYWKLTVEYTDINEEKFIGTLCIIVEFIDSNLGKPYNPKLYKELQDIVYKEYPKVDYGSIRKSINQFVKLGFIEFQLQSYHINTKDFLYAKTNRKRESIFSKIFYTNSSFNKTVTNYSNRKEINFLIKTLENIGKLHKSDIEAMMLVDIENVDKGYLTYEELVPFKIEAEKIDFKIRKYNQVGYLFNFLNKLDDVIFVKNELYFKEDARRIFGDELRYERKIRDPYLHRLYKLQLQDESLQNFNDAKCMVERLAYPVLIASHIKPFFTSTDEEAYDPNNGILLSRNIDSLFDLGYITFENDGRIKFSETERLNQELKDFIGTYSLDSRFINEKRLEYLEYHRSEVFGKRYKYA